VHEIDKEGRVVRLTDVNPPVHTESQSDASEEVRSLVFWLHWKFVFKIYKI